MIVKVNNTIIIKEGILNRYEKKSAFPGVISISLNQSLLGMIFNYATIFVDVVGKNNLSLSNVSNPKELKAFLEKYTTENSTNNIQTIIVE